MLSDSRSQADDDAGDAFRQRVEVRVDVRREAFPGDRPGFATCARIAGANVAVYAGWWLLPEAFMVRTPLVDLRRARDADRQRAAPRRVG